MTIGEMDLALTPEGEQDNVVIVRWQGHEIVYSLTEPNGDVSAFEDKVPAWAKAMGILHAMKVILEIGELESILSVACARMRELHRFRNERKLNVQDMVDITNLSQGGPNRG